MQTQIWQYDIPPKMWHVVMSCYVCGVIHTADRFTYSGIVKAALFFHEWGCRCKPVQYMRTGEIQTRLH